MNFQCLASPHVKANSTGEIALRCDPRELVVQHLSVRRQKAKGPQAAISGSSQSRIPWSEVRVQRWGGDQLFLDLGAGRTQLNRFCLTRFVSRPRVEASGADVRKSMVWGLAAGAIAWGLLTFIESQTARSAAPAQKLLILAASAATVVMARLSVAKLWMVRSGSSRQVLQELTALLKERGATFSPADLQQSSSNAGPFGARPGSDWAVTVALAVTTLAAWISWVPGQMAPNLAAAAAPAPPTHGDPSSDSVDREQGDPKVTVKRHAVLPATSAVKPPPPPLAAAASSQFRVENGQCSCERSNSPLWSSPIPRLSTLVVNAKTTKSGQSKRTTLELAVVNNGDSELADLTLSVEFPNSETPGTSRTATSTLRPLFYAGPLHPGRSVKWSVEGPGEEFRIVPPPLGNLESKSGQFATIAAFKQLTDARTREVRLHAAKMLTYLGAPGARDGVSALLAEGVESERVFLEQLLKASSPTRTCDLKNDAATGTVTGCLFNASEEPLTVEAIELSALDADSPNWVPSAASLEFLTPRTHAVETKLPPQTGKPFVLSSAEGTAFWQAPVHLSGQVEAAKFRP